MATKQRRPDPANTNQANENDNDDLKFDGMKFWPHIKTIKTDQWLEDYVIYCYRDYPRFVGQKGLALLCKYNEPVDEIRILQDHGGGSFKIYFNCENKSGQAKYGAFSRTTNLSLGGEAKIQPGVVLENPSISISRLPQNGAAPQAPAVTVTSPDQMISLVREIVNKEGQSPQDSMKQTLELLTMAKALQAPPAATAASDPFRDEMMKMMMAKMLKDEPSPSSDLKDILVAINNKLDRPQPSGMDFMKIMTGIPVFSAAFEEITGRGLMDVVGAVFGRGGAAVATEDAAKQGIMGWLQGGGLQEILEKAPTLMKTFDEMSANSMQRAVALENWKIQMAERQAAIAAGQTPPAQVISPQSAAQPPAQPAKVITMQPAAESAASTPANGTSTNAPMRGASIPFGAPATAAATQSNGHSAPPSNLIETGLVDQNGDNVTVTPEALAQAQEMQMAFFLELIVRSYRAGDGGGDVADMLIDLYPDILAQQLPMFKIAGPAQVIAWASSNPILSEIAADKDFPNFIDDFLHKVKKWEPEPASAPDPVASA